MNKFIHKHDSDFLTLYDRKDLLGDYNWSLQLYSNIACQIQFNIHIVYLSPPFVYMTPLLEEKFSMFLKNGL